MYGFAQGWNVETEMPVEEAKRRGFRTAQTGPPQAGPAQPAAA
jgi:hypothetical protein